MVHKGDLQVRVWQVQRDVMNDTVATEDQEQPAGCHQRKARVADRDPGRRTSSGPADICSAPKEAGHMTAADQIVRSAKKVLAMEGRPHMTTFAPILMSSPSDSSVTNPHMRSWESRGSFQSDNGRSPVFVCPVSTVLNPIA